MEARRLAMMPSAFETLPTSCDILIIGAGPAGAIAALLAAKKGFDTVLVDRASLPRNKVCGCSLTQRGVNQLQSAGIAEILDDAAHISRMRLITAHRSASISIPPYRVISRELLDTRIATAATSAGAKLLTNTSALVHTNCVTLTRNNQSELCTPRCIIIADGISGTSLRDHPAFAWTIAPASRMGLGTTLSQSPIPLEPNELAMLVRRDGYIGLVKLPGSTIDLAAAADPASVRAAGGPAAWLIAAFTQLAGDCTQLAKTRIHGTPLLTRKRNRVAHENIFLIGNAAAYVEPFTGEGMTWALETGTQIIDFAAKIITNKLLPSQATPTAQAWQAHYNHSLVPKHRACERVATSVRSPLRHAALSLASFAPSLASSIASRVLRVREVPA
jgi:flavin-dependent dehydrogenase